MMPQTEGEIMVAFWKRVHRSETSRCWIWTGAKRKTWSGPYGQFTIGGSGRVFRSEAHRFSYEMLVGKIPPGLVLDHLCRNTICVNPAHLEPVTNIENTMRGFSPMAINARKTHCPKGHPLEGENLKIDPKSRRRFCWTCKQAANSKPKLRLLCIVAFSMMLNK